MNDEREERERQRLTTRGFASVENTQCLSHDERRTLLDSDLCNDESRSTIDPPMKSLGGH
jgi:hypothetical protein